MRADRHPVGEDNIFRVVERNVSDQMVRSLEAWGETRDRVSEALLLQIYGQPLLQALSTAVDRLSADFGTWRTPWGDINRFQRFKNTIAPEFDDSAPSIPVGYTAATWGSLDGQSLDCAGEYQVRGERR